MARLSAAPPLTLSHSPLFTIAVEPVNETLLVPPESAIEAALGLVRVTPESVALPPLTLRALEPALLVVSVPLVMLSVPPLITAAAWAVEPIVVTLTSVAVIDEFAPVTNKPLDEAPDEVRDVLQVEIDYLDALIDALEQVEPGDEAEAALQVQAGTAAHPDVDEAAAELAAYTAGECSAS